MDQSDFLYSLQQSLYQSIRLPLAMAGVMNPFAHVANEFGSAFFDEPQKPTWGIREVKLNDGTMLPVTEEVILDHPFCELRRFRQGNELVTNDAPRLLVVAPLSGHYATLLRRHVRILLPHFDVTITDWKDPRHIPEELGNFSTDDYVDFLLQAFDAMDERGIFNMVAVCQPGPLALVAAAIAENKNVPRPESLTLIAAPIDTRKNPTHVNKLAKRYPLSFFDKQLECVPPRFKGRGRVVYPSHLQLAGFMLPNMGKHVEAHMQDFVDRLSGNSEGTKKHGEFYNEFNAVMPLPQPYHMETLMRVFMDHDLPRGAWTHRGIPVSLDWLRETKILTIEGERDDICGRGQTEAAHELTPNIPEGNKFTVVIPDAGHYGAFQGKAFAVHGLPEMIRISR